MAIQRRTPRSLRPLAYGRSGQAQDQKPRIINRVLSSPFLILSGAFFLGLLLRMILIPNPGFEADISFWKSWGLATFDRGIVEGMKVTNNNYPTPFAYTLGLMVRMYSLFADPHNFNEFWSNTNPIFLTVSKLPAVLADFGIAAIILWIGRNAKKLGFPHVPFSVFFVLSSLYLVNPIGIIDGAWWGQVDSLGVFIFLLAIVAALSKRPFLGGLLYMTAMMTKLQNMIYGPLFFVFLWQSLGYRGLVAAIAGATFGFFGLNIEFFLARDMGRVLTSLTENYDYFPFMSLNAFNLWWIVAGARGMQVSDKLLTLGIVNAKTVGLLLFSSFYLFAVLKQLFSTNPIVKLFNGQIVHKKTPKTAQQFNNLAIKQFENEQYGQNTLRSFIESLILVNAAFFLFQTQSHDRYAFPLSVFLLLWAPFFAQGLSLPRKERPYEANVLKRFALYYLLFTLLYFYNLHTALVFNYPNNGLPLLSLLIQPIVTIAVSVALLGLFLAYLWYLLRRSHPFSYILPSLLFLIAIIGFNKALLFKKPVSLTTLVPFASHQDYATRMINMPANSSFGFPKWSPLSVQYAYYRRGIGTHAKSFLTYDIGRRFRRFSTDYGIDTQAGERASSTFEIYGDDKLLFASEPMGRFTMPRHVELDVRGVKTLGLVTTDAGDGITDDHTDWLRPTLWP